MARIFISYSRKNEDIARRLAGDLDQLGADVWIDVDDIPAGMKWSKAIQQGLDQCEVMIVIISPDSMASTNVEDEWQYQLDQDKPLVPVLWQPTKVQYQLSRIQYIDFHKQPYDEAFAQLHSELRRKGIKLAALSATNPSIQLPAQQPLPVQGKNFSRAYLALVAVIALIIIAGIFAGLSGVFSGDNSGGATQTAETQVSEQQTAAPTPESTQTDATTLQPTQTQTPTGELLPTASSTPPFPAVITSKIVINANSCPAILRSSELTELCPKSGKTHIEGNLPAITLDDYLTTSQMALVQGFAVAEDSENGRISLRIGEINPSCCNVNCAQPLPSDCQNRPIITTRSCPAACPEYSLAIYGSINAGKYTGAVYLNPSSPDEHAIPVETYVRDWWQYAGLVLILGILTSIFLQRRLKQPTETGANLAAGRVDLLYGAIILVMVWLSGVLVLYYNNSTFGSSMDYIKTFLWGAVGQTTVETAVFLLKPGGIPAMLKKIRDYIIAD